MDGALKAADALVVPRRWRQAIARIAGKAASHGIRVTSEAGPRCATLALVDPAGSFGRSHSRVPTPSVSARAPAQARFRSTWFTAVRSALSFTFEMR